MAAWVSVAGSGQTTSTTPLEIDVGITVPTNSALVVLAQVFFREARPTFAEDSEGIIIMRRARRAGGSPTLSGSLQTLHDSGFGARSASFVINGNDVRVEVTSDSTDTVNWNVHARYITVQ